MTSFEKFYEKKSGNGYNFNNKQTSALYRKYEEFCIENRMPAIDKKLFNTKLLRLGFKQVLFVGDKHTVYFNEKLEAKRVQEKYNKRSNKEHFQAILEILAEHKKSIVNKADEKTIEAIKNAHPGAKFHDAFWVENVFVVSI